MATFKARHKGDSPATAAASDQHRAEGFPVSEQKKMA
jgi:hypothetical protein